MKLSTIAKLLKPKTWVYDNRNFKENWNYDLQFNASFRGTQTIGQKLLRTPQFRYLKLYRKCQAAVDTIWYYPLFHKLEKMSWETGMGLHDNLNIPKGIIIGHSGTIVINACAKFEGNVYLTHNVTIGRDVRGKRVGAPTIGKNVCIRTNSTVTGNITIGEDVLIAPNTFVNFDVPPHSVVIGNPATIHHKNNATEGHIGFVKE